MARRDLQPYPGADNIRVKQEDIDYGIRHDSYGCALAHAIMRSNPNAIRVRVNKKRVAWTDEVLDARIIYPTPALTDKNLIQPFDEGREVKPQTVHLRNGETRSVDRSNSRANRQRQREEKVRRSGNPNPEPTAARSYERYVTAGENL